MHYYRSGTLPAKGPLFFRMIYRTDRSPQSRQDAFTLVEMLAVTGIVIAMMALITPVVNDVLNSRGRKAAVNLLLNTFEQARVLALEQSDDVYVGFAVRNFPSSAPGQQNDGFPYTRFIVFRKSDPGGLDPADTSAYIPLTKWRSLPSGIAFKSGTATITSATSGATIDLKAADRFPGVSADYAMPVVKFNNTGMIEQPTSNLTIFIYEGYWSGTTEVFTRANNGNLFERITFSRFTGRAQLDITTT